MDKVIPFNKGIRRQPSLGEAGELSECVNLIPQNGELVNVRGMKLSFDLSEGDRLLCIHRTPNSTNYIVANDNNIGCYIEMDDGTSDYNGFEDVGMAISATAVGKIVIVSMQNDNAYLMWDGNGYNYLGVGIPHLDVWVRTSHAVFGYTEAEKVEYRSVFSADYNSEESVKSNLKPLYIEAMNNAGKDAFIEPFFLRYAYEMYDGSILDCSVPILVCCPKYYPSVIAEYGRQDNGILVQFVGLKNDVIVSVLNSEEEKTQLSNIKELIRNVNFYIAPINTVGDNFESVPYKTGLTSNQYYSYTDGDVAKVNVTNLTNVLGGTDGGYNRNSIYRKTLDELEKEVINATNFYLLKKVKFDEFIKGNNVTLNANLSFSLRDIRSQPRLELDDVNIAVSSKHMFHYNGRLIRLNLNKALYKKGAQSFFSYVSKNSEHVKLYFAVKIEENGIVRYVRMNNENEGEKMAYMDNNGMSQLLYFFYPNINAKTLFINYKWGSMSQTVKVDLTRHPILNGCYAYNDMKSLSNVVFSDTIPQSDEFYSYPNEVVVSGANNPFVFSSINNLSVGDGYIKGAATSAKALSQGQFGQFPLYVFCSDGIWALEVADDGTFSAKQPVSRDVCNNPESITQIDGAVVFTTDQGLKLIQGSEVVLLSGHLEGHNVDEDVYFKKSEDGTGFFAKYNLGEFNKLINPESRDIRDIFKTCSIAYDYVNQLLRIFPKREEGADTKVPYKYYVYSFTTNEFATVIGNEFAVEKDGEITYNEVTKVVPDYPSSIVQIGSKLYRPMETEREGLQDGLILTRPLTLDEPFALKKLQDMRLNYSNFKGDSNRNSKCRVVLYVSNDGHKWTMISSFRGGAYKYFRIAVATKLTDADALTGAVMRYSLERTNKLR